MSDEDIDTSDIPPLSDQFFETAKLRLPASSEATIAVRIDTETLTWFQHQGEESEKHMTAALRIYAEAHKYTEFTHKSA
jgi:uncharacterized protein (DUF4415 family)